MSEEVTIDHMGAAGDGVAKTATGAVFVPFTLPGEIVTIARDGARATVMGLKKVSAQRIEPACRHFEECGGCVLQHMNDVDYQEFKRNLVVDAMRGRGIETEISPLIACPQQARRRITLTARTTAQGQSVGFNRYQSHDIVAIEECPVAHPQLIARLGDIRALAAILANNAKSFHLIVTLAENGLDIAITDCPLNDEHQRQNLIRQALDRKIARLSIDGEIIVETLKPIVTFDDVAVEFPAGGFLQATQQAQQEMTALILKGLKKVKNAADLFSGCGTFTFPMARQMNVHAVENDAPSLASLDRAYRQATGLKTLTHERRDLFRRPLSVKELAHFDGVVFDPPRAGAEEQVKELAKTTLARVVAVSCNPVTLARDLAILQDGGFKVEKIVPIDQFLWSPHVEAVAYLSKRKPKPGWKL